jgi:hypothetical protein
MIVILVEEALLKRRSVRAYANRSLILEKISQLPGQREKLLIRRGFRQPFGRRLYP